MRRTSLLVIASAVFAGLAACDAPVTSPETTSEAASVTSSTSTVATSGPRLLAVEGASVDRFQRVVFLLHLDADRELLSVHAPSNLCSTFQFGVAEVQAVTTPSEIEQRIVQLKGRDLPVAVYEADSFADAGFSGSFDLAGVFDLVDFGAFCAFLTGPDRVAEGTVRRVSNLSNASFSVTWTGTLDLVAGGRTQLTELYQLTADAQEPNDTSQWSVNASKVVLH